MSKYSGKCDLWDSLVSIGERVYTPDNCRIYIHDAEIKWQEIDDLLPFASHLISIGCFQRDGISTIYLSKESFVDTEEIERISLLVKDVIRAACKLKRSKNTIDYYSITNHLSDTRYSDQNRVQIKSVLEVLAEHPDYLKFDIHLKDWKEYLNYWIKITRNYFSGIHTSFHTYEREILIKDWEEKFGDRYSPRIQNIKYQIQEYYDAVDRYEKES